MVYVRLIGRRVTGAQEATVASMLLLWAWIERPRLRSNLPALNR